MALKNLKKCLKVFFIPVKRRPPRVSNNNFAKHVIMNRKSAVSEASRKLESFSIKEEFSAKISLIFAIA